MKPRVLIYDIESAGVNALHPDLGFVTHFGYKWLGKNKVHSLTFDKFGGYLKHGYTDRGLLLEAQHIIEKADLLVAHYGDRFDRKFINGRLMINGLRPLPSTKQFDTCLMAWKHFNFSGNRLKQLAKFLECKNQKADNEFPGWWHRLLAGDREAIRLMAVYNKQDVVTLEEVYLRMRPFVPEHVRLYERGRCRICGYPVNLKGMRRTKELTYQRTLCTNPDCGTWDSAGRITVAA